VTCTVNWSGRSAGARETHWEFRDAWKTSDHCARFCAAENSAKAWNFAQQSPDSTLNSAAQDRGRRVAARETTCQEGAAALAAAEKTLKQAAGATARRTSAPSSANNRIRRDLGRHSSECAFQTAEQLTA
jgi:hypothetical protein